MLGFVLRAALQTRDRLISLKHQLHHKLVDSKEEVLRQIFHRDLGWFSPSEDQAEEVASIGQLEAFAELLGQEPPEERLQAFLASQPQIITGNFGWGDDSTLALFVKPRIGTRFVADFSVLHFGQGGCTVHLLELERSAGRLFNRDLSQALDLRRAIKQIEDWQQWITENRDTFVRDAVSAAQKLPLRGRENPSSYRTREGAEIEQMWTSFGGFSDPVVQFHIIMGRWALLSRDEQKRLIFLNRQRSSLFDITTYDQLARRAFDRPYLRY
jgi:hypothetical protein